MSVGSTSASAAASPRSVLIPLAVVLLVLLCFATESSAKRGCSAFGHSCFGGHGKRSEPTNRVEDMIQDEAGTREENQDYEAPRGGGEILIPDGGQSYQDRPMSRFQPMQVMQVPQQQQHPRYNSFPFMRQWKVRLVAPGPAR